MWGGHGTTVLLAGCIVGLDQQFKQFMQGRLRCMFQEWAKEIKLNSE